jgi:acetyl-CoA carboxylase biotin carboxyl carrier protein
MWKMHEIREIINLFEDSLLQELEVDLEEGDSKISLKKQGGIAAAVTTDCKPAALSLAVPASAPVPAEKKTPKPQVQLVSPEPKPVKVEQPKPVDVSDPALFKIVSPMVGTFYHAPEIDADPYVKRGDKVQKSTVVCIVEAMKLFNEIEAEVNGEIVDVLVENGQLVEQGQPLFLVKTE